MKINLQARAQAGERKRLRTRAALIEAARQVIAAKGPHAVSIDEFTVAAGVSRGTFYNYFPTLDDLIMALAADIIEALDRELQVSIAEVDDPVERLALSCITFIEMGVDDPVWGWVFLRLDGTAMPRVEQARKVFERDFRRAQETGRLRPVSLAAGYALTAGAVRMAVRTILTGAERDCGRETVQLILIGLGLDPGEALRVCRARPAR